jgi:hypothetical protein
MRTSNDEWGFLYATGPEKSEDGLIGAIKCFPESVGSELVVPTSGRAISQLGTECHYLQSTIGHTDRVFYLIQYKPFDYLITIIVPA